jgi:hypothetical protein
MSTSSWPTYKTSQQNAKCAKKRQNKPHPIKKMRIKHYDANGKLTGYTEQPDSMIDKLIKADLAYCYIIWAIYAIGGLAFLVAVLCAQH